MMTKEELIGIFTNWVEESIDSWIQSSDDDPVDMRQLDQDLSTADEYFYNEFDNFIEENGYETDIEWLDEFDDIIENYVQESIEYLEEKYEYWNN